MKKTHNCWWRWEGWMIKWCRDGIRRGDWIIKSMMLQYVAYEISQQIVSEHGPDRGADILTEWYIGDLCGFVWFRCFRQIPSLPTEIEHQIHYIPQIWWGSLDGWSHVLRINAFQRFAIRSHLCTTQNKHGECNLFVAMSSSIRASDQNKNHSSEELNVLNVLWIWEDWDEKHLSEDPVYQHGADRYYCYPNILRVWN